MEIGNFILIKFNLKDNESSKDINKDVLHGYIYPVIISTIVFVRVKPASQFIVNLDYN